MTKAEMIDAIATDANVPKATVERVLESFVDLTVRQVAKGVDVGYPKLGVFSRNLRPARSGRNPSTGAAIDIPARYAVNFRPAKPLRDAMPAAPAGK